MDGTVTLVAAYLAGETDVDGLAVGGGKAYLITDDQTPPTLLETDAGAPPRAGPLLPRQRGRIVEHDLTARNAAVHVMDRSRKKQVGS